MVAVILDRHRNSHTGMKELIQHTIDTPYLVGPVHFYSGELAGELVLFDTGPPTPQCRAYLQENIDLSRLRHIVVTHCHIDHYGQAAWLTENSDATLYLPWKDCLKIEHHHRRIEGMQHLLKGFGFSDEYLAELRQIFESGSLFPPLPQNYRVAEEEVPGRLGIEIVGCPGHSQSDLVYLVGEQAVTGDTLLTGIFQSPLLDLDLEKNVRFNNYEAYCLTLRKLAQLKSRRILPGHRQKVSSVLATLRFYVTKLLLRVEQLLPYREIESLPELIRVLLDGRMTDVFLQYLKGSEIIFMKDLLARPELLRESLVQVGLFGELGELYYRATGSHG